MREREGQCVSGRKCATVSNNNRDFSTHLRLHQGPPIPLLDVFQTSGQHCVQMIHRIRGPPPRKAPKMYCVTLGAKRPITKATRDEAAANTVIDTNVINKETKIKDKKGTPKNFCDKNFAELSGELSGAIATKVPSNCSENSLVLFVRFFGFGVRFWPLKKRQIRWGRGLFCAHAGDVRGKCFVLMSARMSGRNFLFGLISRS